MISDCAGPAGNSSGHGYFLVQLKATDSAGAFRLGRPHLLIPQVGVPLPLLLLRNLLCLLEVVLDILGDLDLAPATPPTAAAISLMQTQGPNNTIWAIERINQHRLADGVKNQPMGRTEGSGSWSCGETHWHQAQREACTSAGHNCIHMMLRVEELGKWTRNVAGTDIPV